MGIESNCREVNLRYGFLVVIGVTGMKCMIHVILITLEGCGCQFLNSFHLGMVCYTMCNGEAGDMWQSSGWKDLARNTKGSMDRSQIMFWAI